jgi:integrase
MDRCSTFTAVVQLGGFLTCSLRDELILPANYYDIRDLFATTGIKAEELKGLNGEPWRNPYVPTTETLNRALSHEELFELIGLGSRRQERKRALPGRWAGREVRTLSNDDIAMLIADYIPCPTFPLLYKLGLLLDGGSETAAKLRARQILLALNKKGLGHAGKPIRLVPHEKFSHFLEVACNEELAAQTWQRTTKDRVMGLLATMAFTGMRLGEAIRMRGQNICRVGKYETIFIDGTKVDRAKRNVPTVAIRTGSNGEDLYKWWRSFLASGSVTDAGEPLFASKDEGSKRYSDLLKSVLTGAFASLNAGVEGEDPRTAGTYSAYSLRHATALRLTQGAIDSDFECGNFSCALAEISQCLGHSLPTLLSSYVGTACLVLRWP